jgi:hypothetical protein
MDLNTTKTCGECPLCHQPNHCQLCNPASYKGPCWCFSVEVPPALLEQVPPALKNRACICRACITAFNQKKTAAPRVRAGDFYFDAGGLLVFTAEYHLRRGFCCGSGCRHCPYPLPAIIA